MKITLLAVPFLLLSYALVASAQDFGARHTFSLNGTFQPDSDHIWMGEAKQRRIWTAGLEYSRRLWSNRLAAIRYQGSVSPFVQESDPAIVGIYPNLLLTTTNRPE